MAGKKAFPESQRNQNKGCQTNEEQFPRLYLLENGARPGDDRKSKLYNKIRELLCRRKAAAQPLSLVFTKVNQVVRGWINNWRYEILSI